IVNTAAVSRATLKDQLYRSSHYGKRLKQLLPEEAFRPRPIRLLFGAMHLAIVLGMGYLTMATPAPAWMKVLAACAAGQSWAVLGLFAHELWHGSVLKSGPVEHWLGSICWAIQMPSATAWKIWHNKTHHTNTNIGRLDPDAMPWLEAVRTLKAVRFGQRMAP